jgi:predicted DCC family thiol-disulfide oxidoreductase YuxK
MDQPPIIFFDGICNYCNALVNFIIRQDKKKIFRFAAMQNETGQQFLRENHLPLTDPETFYLLQRDKIYSRSAAALKILGQLPWYWKWTQFFWIFPRFIRDFFYTIVARNRYRWFGKKDTCMIPRPGLKERFYT